MADRLTALGYLDISILKHTAMAVPRAELPEPAALARENGPFAAGDGSSRALRNRIKEAFLHQT
jgi:hypothetical protein